MFENIFTATVNWLENSFQPCRREVVNKLWLSRHCKWRDIKVYRTVSAFSISVPSNFFLSSCLFPLPKEKKKVCFPSQSKSGFPYQMDHITLRRDNRDIPTLLCFSFSPHQTLAHFRLFSHSLFACVCPLKLPVSLCGSQERSAD